MELEVRSIHVQKEESTQRYGVGCHISLSADTETSSQLNGFESHRGRRHQVIEYPLCNRISVSLAFLKQFRIYALTYIPINVYFGHEACKNL